MFDGKITYDFDVKFSCPRCEWRGDYGMMYGMKCPKCRYHIPDSNMTVTHNQLKERIKKVLLS